MKTLFLRKMRAVFNQLSTSHQGIAFEYNSIKSNICVRLFLQTEEEDTVVDECKKSPTKIFFFRNEKGHQARIGE